MVAEANQFLQITTDAVKRYYRVFPAQFIISCNLPLYPYWTFKLQPYQPEPNRSPILSYLPIQDLLYVKGICRQWRNIIQASSTLLQQLYLRPVGNETVWLADITNLPAENEVLSEDDSIHTRFQSVTRVRCAAHRQSEAVKTHFGPVLTPVHPNPLVSGALAGGWQTLDMQANRLPIVEFSVLLLERLTEVEHHTIQRMFLTQPPVTNTTIEVVDVNQATRHIWTRYGVLNRCRYNKGSVKLFNERGVRLGQVVAAANKMIENRSIDRELITYITLQLHGVVEASESNEEVVRQRALE